MIDKFYLSTFSGYLWWYYGYDIGRKPKNGRSRAVHRTNLGQFRFKTKCRILDLQELLQKTEHITCHTSFSMRKNTFMKALFVFIAFTQRASLHESCFAMSTTSKYFKRKCSLLSNLSTTKRLRSSQVCLSSSDDASSTQKQKRASSRTQSFSALVYDKEYVPVHTLILGTHPSIQSLSKKQYYGHPMNAWVVFSKH